MGYLFAFTSVFLWSFNYIVAVSFANSLQPFEIALGRWLIASVVLSFLAYSELKTVAGDLFKHWRQLLGLAITGMVLCNTAIYYAGETAKPLNMTLLSLTGPIFIVILSAIWLKTKISRLQTIGFVIAILGVVTIIVKGDFRAIGQIHLVIGDGWMLLNAFSFAVYTLLQHLRPHNISQKAMLTASSWLGVLIIFPLACIEKGGLPLTNLNLRDLEVFLYLGILNSVVAYLAWNEAIAQIGEIKTGIIFYTIPLFSGIEAYFIMQQSVSIPQIIGGALIVVGIIAVNKQPSTKTSEQS